MDLSLEPHPETRLINACGFRYGLIDVLSSPHEVNRADEGGIGPWRDAGALFCKGLK